MTFEHATIKATPDEAIIRFAASDGTLGPTLHIKASFEGEDRFELWAPGGRLIGNASEFTLLGLLNAAVHGEDVL